MALSDIPVVHKDTTFPWSKRREKGALLVALDDKSDEEIATELKVKRLTIERWKTRTGFMAKVEEHRAGWREEFKDMGIADRRNRVEFANERHRLLQQVIKERAADPLLVGVPGGSTGLIVPEPMLVKVYETREDDDTTLRAIPKLSEMAYKYSLDTGLLKEMRELEKQIAQDLGQWTEKIQVEFEKAREEVKKMLMEDGLSEAEAVATVEEYLRLKV